MKTVRTMFAIALLVAALPARTQTSAPYDEIAILHNYVSSNRGSIVRLGGIDYFAATRLLTEAAIDCNARLTQLEKAKP